MKQSRNLGVGGIAARRGFDSLLRAGLSLAWFSVPAFLVGCGVRQCLGAEGHAAALAVPPELSTYTPEAGRALSQVLAERVSIEPFNLVATIIFLLAIVHTFLASKFLRIAHRYEKELAGSTLRDLQEGGANAGLRFRA